MLSIHETSRVCGGFSFDGKAVLQMEIIIIIVSIFFNKILAMKKKISRLFIAPGR